MTLVAVGELSIGAAMPGVSAALFAANADLEARIAAYANFGIGITLPSLEADLAVAVQTVAALTLNLSLGIQPPSIALQFELLIAELALLRINLEVILHLMSQLSAVGLHVYAYSGTVDGIGADLTAELAGGFPGGAGSDACNALILATSVGATWLALSEIMKVTP